MAKTILIVEDDPNISELVQMYLEKEGYNTRIASDGGQGLDLFRQLRPDLVLLDIMLPGMDGWTARPPSSCSRPRARRTTRCRA